MTRKPDDRFLGQLWVDSTFAVIYKAKELAVKERMTFQGWVGRALEKAVAEASNDKSDS